MFDMRYFNGYLYSFKSPLTAHLQQCLQGELAFGEQDTFTCFSMTHRDAMAVEYGAWLNRFGIPIKDSDIRVYGRTLASGLYLQNSICMALINKTYCLVTQSGAYAAAISNAHSPHAKEAIQRELTPSISDIRNAVLPVALLGRGQHGLFVKDKVMLSEKNLHGVVPFIYYLRYGMKLAESLFNQSLIVSYRGQDREPLRTEVSLFPNQMREYYRVSTHAEARKVISNQLEHSDTLGRLLVFKMKKGHKLYPLHMNVLSITSIVPS
ncbi:hypothetical protein [Paenibacillus sp. FSL R5-0912]|uniref:hypothetical protein n=1 Tax=Paenibacillus sp. FSL R5-0912 TaxID=1536771 RepID=UPI0004F6EF97|nr:hypothetical protein [Paenibacillus sp. FSL R5-0912]AIQ40515.1 hypothetical protein R50912_11140 [Paenibacillus sp. FSL R5-0912]